MKYYTVGFSFTEVSGWLRQEWMAKATPTHTKKKLKF